MKRATLILVPLILTACTAQLAAYEQSTPRVINPETFEPIVIKHTAEPIIIKPTTKPALIIEAIEKLEPTKPPINQPTPKKSVVKITKPKSVRTKASANSNPKQYALSKVGQSQFNCLEPLWNKESHWNYKAYNRSSGAYGIPQAVPGSKMSSAGADWRTNPITQVKWGIRYVNGRYGSACGAWNFWRAHHWY